MYTSLLKLFAIQLVSRLQDSLEHCDNAKEEAMWHQVVERLKLAFELDSSQAIDSKSFKSVVIRLFNTKLQRRTFKNIHYLALSKVKCRELKRSHSHEDISSKFLSKFISEFDKEFVYIFNENAHISIHEHKDAVRVQMNGKIIAHAPLNQLQMVMRVILASKPCCFRYTAACDMLLSFVNKNEGCQTCMKTGGRRVLAEKTNIGNCKLLGQF